MIDWSRVNELRDEVGADDFGEVVELFLAEVEEVLLRLGNGPAGTDLGQDLHFLKGSALSLGFTSFSKLCQEGESQSANGGATTVDVAEILRDFELSKATFLSELPKHATV